MKRRAELLRVTPGQHGSYRLAHRRERRDSQIPQEEGEAVQLGSLADGNPLRLIRGYPPDRCDHRRQRDDIRTVGVDLPEPLVRDAALAGEDRNPERAEPDEPRGDMGPR